MDKDQEEMIGRICNLRSARPYDFDGGCAEATNFSSAVNNCLLLSGKRSLEKNFENSDDCCAEEKVTEFHLTGEKEKENGRFQIFLDEQRWDFEKACRELKNGHKRSCWMWYIFPMLEGLGKSEMSKAYAIHGLEDAVEYLRHPTLRSRLVKVTHIVYKKVCEQHVPVVTLMGGKTDALKLVSSLTLFCPASLQLAASSRDMVEKMTDFFRMATAILDAVLPSFRRCEVTQKFLGMQDSRSVSKKRGNKMETKKAGK